MTRHRRSPIVPLVALALLAGGLLAAGPVAAAPTVPGFPAIPLPPGSQTARFTVIVEGTATAAKDFDGGSTAPCVISLQGHVDETTTYRRGKGVVMEFVRLGKGTGAPVMVSRAGRRVDASLALKVRTTRTAKGAASRADVPGAPVTICPPLSEDLSQGADCAKPKLVDAGAALLYSGGNLRVRLNGAAAIGFDPPDCPTSEIVDGLDTLLFGWPTPPAVSLLQVFIPPSVIFGRAKVIVRTLVVRPSPRRKGPVTVSLGGIAQLTLTDFGTNRMTVRLIRVS